MIGNKKELISIRVDSEEKAILEKKAEESCMTMSEFARHALLGEIQLDELGQNLRSTDHIEKMTRCILFTKFATDALMEKSLDKKEIADVYANLAKTFKRYGVYKKEG
jgi:3-isopropylmalate dehydratase small subunit